MFTWSVKHAYNATVVSFSLLIDCRHSGRAQLHSAIVKPGGRTQLGIPEQREQATDDHAKWRTNSEIEQTVSF